MAKVSVTSVGLGTVPGDGTGDPARTGGGYLNTNDTDMAAAINEIASAQWEIDNAGASVALGERIICQSHAGITKTLPAASALVADDYNDVWILNVDTNSDVSVDPNGSEEIYLDGVSLGAGVVATLEPGTAGIFTYRSAGAWNVYKLRIGAISFSDLDDAGTMTATAGNVLEADGSVWQSVSKEAADIVERDVPAIEASPYIHHETLAARSSGTETITISSQPSVYLPISGNNVTIHLDTPALSLPVRGLNDVMFRGFVFVKMNGAYTGLTVTTDAGTKLSTFPKGTAPSASGEWAILTWIYFDDGTTDFIWAEWINDA